MFGLKNYLITEKVSSKEIKSVLNDPNLQIGIEFEMILEDMDEGAGHYDGYSAEELDSMLSDYHNEIRDYVEEIESTGKDYETEYLDEQRKEHIANLKSEIEDKEKDLKELKDVIDDWATTNADDLQDEIDDLELEIEEKEEAIENLETQEGYDLFSLIEEEYDQWVQPKSEYVNDNISYPPSMHNALESFYYNYMGVETPDIEWWETFDDPEYYDAHHIINNLDIYYPSEYLEGQEETGVDSLEDYPYWDDLPFSNYDIGDYHSGSADSPDWRIETDSSLNSGGVEIISPKMTIGKMLKILPKMFKFIKEHGRTDPSTGMHVNLSYKGKSFDNADMLKLMLFVDEGYVWKKFPERKGNTYTSSVLEKILQNVKSNKMQEPDTEKYVRKTVADFKKGVRGPAQKFFGVNTTNKNRIEFRYLGGSDYHKKLKEITTMIGKFGFYTKIALDEKARKKEYILKLNRLHQKFAKNTQGIEITDYDTITKILNKGKALRMRTNEKNTQYYLYKKRKYKYISEPTGKFYMYAL